LKEITIIGAGISGLACGWHLAEAGYKVTILEKEPISGGLAGSFLIKDKWLPFTYRHVLSPDKATQAFIKKLGFLDQLRWVKSTQVFWYEDKFYPLSKPHDIFGFNPLDFKSKIKLIYLGLYVWLRKDWDNLKDTDCDAWLNKIAGEKTTRLLFQNLMDIKFSMPLSSVSAAWLGKRLHQSVRNGHRYGYIESGWQELVNRMAACITERDGKIINNFEVTKISSNGGITGIANGGKPNSVSGDIIVNTAPPPVFNNILNLSGRSTLLLENIKYKSMISFVCGSAKNISGHYWSVVLKPHLMFGGFFNHTVLSSPKDKKGEYVYYFFSYLEDTDPLFGYAEDKIKDLYLNDIYKLFPDFSLNWHRIFKIKFSQPVFTRGYRNPPIELAENLYLAGVYRQFPKPRTMDSAFSSGLETAQYIIKKYGKN
jgi:protoporphyrinogen oxidase